MSSEDRQIITSVEGTGLQAYRDRTEVKEMAGRLMLLHPGAAEVGQKAMLALAQLALLLGANPLPGAKELYVWPDKQGRICFQIGIAFYRRMAVTWGGGVLYAIRPRPMRDQERADYGIPEGHLAAICEGVTNDTMITMRAQGWGASDIFNMAGRVGIATVAPGEYSKQGRPLMWTALKRAEADLLYQLFPLQMGALDQRLAQAPAGPIQDLGIADDLAIEPDSSPEGGSAYSLIIEPEDSPEAEYMARNVGETWNRIPPEPPQDQGPEAQQPQQVGQGKLDLSVDDINAQLFGAQGPGAYFEGGDHDRG